ncbi:hypothetical protein JEQ12_015250 [Ovis aries]|uniref:Uncharacterized protein n=1 Tax=Ovis aries TaxID=9940 RepID=A0A836AM60_SHEEP|nr:hypothetical protein JEQ12_015250 [Ovis aries]
MVLVDVPGRLGSEGPRRPWEEGPDPGLTLVITAARCGDEGTFGEAPELPQGSQLCFDTKVQGHVTAAERSCPSEGCAGDGVQGPHGVASRGIRSPGEVSLSTDEDNPDRNGRALPRLPAAVSSTSQLALDLVDSTVPLRGSGKERHAKTYESIAE